ncbi:MAG: hypothetical protein ACOYME_04795 [Prochlorotrichaceae cyanobacterium]
MTRTASSFVTPSFDDIKYDRSQKRSLSKTIVIQPQSRSFLSHQKQLG